MALGVPVLSKSIAVVPLKALALVVAAACLPPAWAQEVIYRCGNEYTNSASTAKAKGCKPMEGGNITIIQGPVPKAAAAPKAAQSSPPKSGPRGDSAEQRARDSDARQILEAELRKAEERLAQARKAYAGGQPEKEGIESRNHQRYLDRVAELKASVTRAESDVSGLQRELGRMGGSAPPQSTPGSGAAPSAETTAK